MSDIVEVIQEYVIPILNIVVLTSVTLLIFYYIPKLKKLLSRANTVVTEAESLKPIVTDVKSKWSTVSKTADEIIATWPKVKKVIDKIL